MSKNKEIVVNSTQEVAKYMVENKVPALEGVTVEIDGVVFSYQFRKLKLGVDYDKEEEG